MLSHFLFWLLICSGLSPFLSLVFSFDFPLPSGSLFHFDLRLYMFPSSMSDRWSPLPHSLNLPEFPLFPPPLPPRDVVLLWVFPCLPLSTSSSHPVCSSISIKPDQSAGSHFQPLHWKLTGLSKNRPKSHFSCVLFSEMDGLGLAACSKD